MRFQDWINEEVQKPQYANLIPREIAAYLNVRPLTKVPGEGTVTTALGIEEVMGLVTPNEWGAMTSPTAMWRDVASADFATARPIDVLLMQSFKTSNVPLETAAMAVIESENVDMATALITVLAKANLLSPESVAAMQAAMEKPAPSTWVWGESIAQQNGGQSAWVDASQIQTREI